MEASNIEPEPEFLLLTLLTSVPAIIYPIFFIILILLLLSALISGSEVAFFSLTPQQVHKCESSQKSQDIRIAKLLSNPKLLLATILILNNLVNVALITLATFASWEMFGRDAEQKTLFFLNAFITPAIIFFGEISPKVYATEKNLLFARFTSGMLIVATSLFKPFSWLLMSLSSLLEKRLERKGYEVSMTELNEAVEMTTTVNKDKEILKGIVSFSSKTVKQVMQSRIDITAFEIEDNFHELLNEVNKTSYSRIPIYSDTIDKIEGILYVKELLPFVDQDENFNWQNLIKRDTFFVPESKKIDELLKDFQKMRVHMAVIVDEYGGTSGLITMEDIIEEIVGEINDEFDDEEDLGYKKIDNRTYTFEGKMSLNDFYKVLNIDASEFSEAKGESESVGGLLLELFNKLPITGEKIEFKNYVFSAIAVDKKRIKRVRVFMKDGIDTISNQ
ncbi:MAG: gliding motility-associated protein GldE [Flammeovirgaceae bacterium]|nr:gliding motility-associated protein GldE [Flammeovirgaceae bacterium]